MLLTEKKLRRIIREYLRVIVEEAPVKTGTQGASDTEGTLDTKKLADVLHVDAGKLKTAVTDLKSDKRTSTDNQIFGDMVAKLIKAKPDDTTKAMNVLKKVSAEEEEQEI